MRLISILALLTACAFAEPETAADWTAELTKIFNSQPGFVATYHSEGENKSLDATLALDTASGLSYLRLTAVKNGQRMEGRFWCTEAGDMFIDAMGQRAYYPTRAPEFEALRELFPANKDLQPVFVPGLLLERANLGATYEWTPTPQPAWAKFTKEAALGKITPDTVAFTTRDHGELTIDRKTGMLKRQFLNAPEGEKRVLEQISYQPNPGKDAISDVSSRWDLAGAETVLQKEQMAALRYSIFQQLVTAIDAKQLETGEIEKLVRDQKSAFRRLSAFALQDNPDSIFRKNDWKTALAGFKTDLRAKMANVDPPVLLSDEALEARFRLPSTRLSLVSSMAKPFAASPKGRAAVCSVIFGRNASLKSDTDVGRKAVDMIEEAFVLATFEATLLPVMNELWGEVKE